MKRDNFKEIMLFVTLKSYEAAKTMIADSRKMGGDNEFTKKMEIENEDHLKNMLKKHRLIRLSKKYCR